MIVVNARFLTQQVTGVQRFAIEISKILHQLNPEIVFVTPNNITDSVLAGELQAIVIGKNTGVIWEQADLRYYLIQQKKPLLVNFCNSGLLFYKKQLVTIHDMAYMVNPKWFSKRFYRWYSFLIPHIAKGSLKVLTVSNSAKNDIIKYLKIKPEKINVVYNSSYLITNNNFEPPRIGKYILTICTLDPRKNLQNLVTAFKEINSAVKLVIVGLQNTAFGAVFNECTIGSNVIIKGYVPDSELSSLLINAEAFIYVSLYEGFGLPPLEAMQLGCPVIVSDIAAHREVCGDAALYANPNSVGDITTKINAIINNNNLKHELIRAGAENIKRFDWQHSAKKVLNIINEIV